MRDEIALVARARGLATHLIPRASLEGLADAADLAAFARAIARFGSAIEAVTEPWSLPGFERAVRQTTARYLATLRRWPREARSPLDLYTGDLDRKSVRRLIRGAVQGAPAAARLEGLTATPQLPERVLAELAQQHSASAVVALLGIVGHPDASAIAPLVRGAQPELFAIDGVLLRGWAVRAAALAGRDFALREYVRVRVDVVNTQIALLVAQGPREGDPARAFVECGRWLARDAFVSAASASTPIDALTTLQRTLARTPIEPLLPVVATDVDAMERAWYSRTLDELARQARVEPLGPAALLGALVRIDAQSRDLRTLAWGAALGTPPALRTPRLVTP